MKFRPDIEGLRGIAVLLVVLAHAKVPGWAGGFIGVDVFFVISGYLITGLIGTEIERTGTVDYWSFYARRARRLAPALLLMLAVVSGFCLVALPGDVLELQLESGFWAALWLSNAYFAFTSFDYFGTAAHDSLFLHTWSLGVEEQFYLLWPALVVLAWRRQRGGLAWLGWLIAVSFAVSLLLMPVDATSAYYLMPTRLWQLALGGFAYRLFARDGAGVMRAHANQVGWVGAALLALGLVLIDETVAYPGLWALLPALGAAGLLAAGTGADNWVVKVLSSPLLRMPGRISYSWYLWHWPLLMVGPLMGLWPLGGLESLALILCSFLLGWLSFAWVEQPLRRSRAGSARSAVAASVVASLVLAASLHVAADLASPDAGSEPSFQQKVQSLISVPAVYADDRCDQWYFSAELVPCEVEAGDGAGGLMVLLGDSIGTHWLPALQHVAGKRRMRLIVLTKSSCAIVDEPFVYGRIHRRFTECEEWRDAAIAHVRSLAPDMVVVGSASSYAFTPGQWLRGTRRVLDRLAEGGRPVFVLAPSPMLLFHGPGCVVSEGRASPSGVELEAGACTANLVDVEDRRVIESLRKAAAEAPNARMVYLNDLVCPEGVCRALRDGNLVFRDQQHLNASFAQSLGDAVDSRLSDPASPPVKR